MNSRRLWYAFALTFVVLCLAGCSASRHVPQGEFLLDNVKLVINDTTGQIRAEDMESYLRQTPNHKFLWSAKLQLGIYNMSGKDTTKWWNRWIRKIGEAPVIMDSTLTRKSAEQLKRALVNKGFLHASVEVDTTLNTKKRKADVNFTLNPGTPYRINSVGFQFPNDTLRQILMADSAIFPVKEGELLDRELLDLQRELMYKTMRNHGYYGFAKEFVTFNADTTAGSHDVDLTMIVNPPLPFASGGLTLPTHIPYRINKVIVITNYDPVTMDNIVTADADTEEVTQDGTIIRYGKKRYLRPNVIQENLFIHPDSPYKEANVTKTYDALSRLSILKFISIRFIQATTLNGVQWMDAYVLLTPDKSLSLTVELEGTNSEGDLGVAAGFSFTHRNIGKGSETLTTKLRGAYESISGNLDGLLHNRYMEYSAEVGLQFPKFKFPFLKEGFKRSIKASTIFNASINYQERPEYTRVIANAGWNYQWRERNQNSRHKFTLIDINYVYLPESTNNFIDQIAPDNPLLRYSYEDHFIMDMGYGYYHTNKRNQSPWNRSMQRNIYTIRANAEWAGNLLWLLSTIFDHRSNYREDPYKVFGIRYSQYFKIDADFSFLHIFDYRNSLAFRAGFGIGVPYGNSTILPFEKRFYGGGANGVRGWAVRTLGPGRFASTNSVSDFIHQCGDIRLILSAEYRAKLFWVVEIGAFIDAGNIWTIHNYATQPEGMFHFNSFYKELAAAYGLGIRLDFDYFLIRFDLGMKAHNPASNASTHWPLLHPRWGRDHSFHFSIGYPF